MVNIGSTGYAKLTRLRRIAETALGNNNPYQRAAMPSPPTISVSASSDGTLGPIVQMANGSALSTAASTKVTWYGGVPEITGSAYVRMPVTTTLPSSAGNAGGSNNSWANAAEIETDAIAIEFCIYHNNTKVVMFQVDGQYVDFNGSAGLGASNADTLIKLTFATRKVRRIRLLMPTTNASGPSMLKFIRATATCTFWKPAQDNAIRVGWFGDSYSEGTNGSASVYPIPNAAWPVLTCELLGFRDCRQLAIGGSGYLATLSGTRSKFRDAIPLLTASAPFDLLVVTHGYNDSANTAAAIQAEATLALALLRSTYSGVPIVVFGCQAGAAGPSAAQIAAEGAISAAVTAMFDPLCKFVPVSTDAQTWLNGTGKAGATNGSGNSDFYVDGDGIHPSLAGEEFLAFRSAKAIRTALASMG